MPLTHVNFFPKMKYFLVTAFACMTILAFSSAEPPCHMQEVFTCLDNEVNYLNSLPRRSLPQTNDDVEKFCKAMNDTLSCLGDFRRRCMTPIQNELVNLAIEGTLDMRSELCGNPQSALRTNYLKHAECLNKVSQGEGINNNLQYLLAVAEQFLKIPNVERINFACCGYAKLYHSIRSEAVNTCGEEATRAAEQFIEMAVAQLPSVICTGYDGTGEECTAVLPPDGSKPSEEFRENSIYKFIFNLLKNYLE